MSGSLDSAAATHISGAPHGGSSVVELRIVNPLVAGSIPVPPANFSEKSGAVRAVRSPRNSNTSFSMEDIDAAQSPGTGDRPAPSALDRVAGDVKPVRLQLSRKRGFSLQAWSHAINGLPAVNCARPGKWGNLWRVGTVACGCRSAGECTHNQFRCETAAEAVESYREWANGWRNTKSLLGALGDIRGKNLACWCRLCPAHEKRGKPLAIVCPNCAPCHVDVLGELVCQAIA